MAEKAAVRDGLRTNVVAPSKRSATSSDGLKRLEILREDDDHRWIDLARSILVLFQALQYEQAYGSLGFELSKTIA